MYPLLSRYGPFFLYTYQVVLSLGVVLALGGRLWRVRGRPEAWRMLDGLLWAAGGALIGGRLGYVIWHADYYRQHVEDIARLDQGGLAYHGALLAGLLTLWLWLRRQPQADADYLDWCAPALATLSWWGWLACYLSACAYGQPTALSWLAANLPDSYGVYAVRYQTQLAGLVSAAIAWFMARRWPGPGRLGLVVGWLSLSRALIALGRGDGMPLLGGIRLDIWLDLGLLALAGLYVVRRRRVSPGVHE